MMPALPDSRIADSFPKGNDTDYLEIAFLEVRVKGAKTK